MYMSPTDIYILWGNPHPFLEKPSIFHILSRYNLGEHLFYRDQLPNQRFMFTPENKPSSLYSFFLP